MHFLLIDSLKCYVAYTAANTVLERADLAEGLDIIVAAVWDDLFLDLVENVEGRGNVSGRVDIAGLFGIYAFCLGLLASLSVSTAFEALDMRARRQIADAAFRSDAGQASASTKVMGDVATNAPLSMHARVPASPQKLPRLIALGFLSVVIVVLGVLGTVSPVLRRSFNGSLPQIIATALFGGDLAKLESDYSLWDMTSRIGYAGGGDTFLMQAHTQACITFCVR